MIINPKVYEHLEEYRQSWQQDQIVTIKDLFIEQDANHLNHYLLNVSDDRWSYSIHPYMENNYVFENTEANKEHIKNGMISANDAYHRGEFSYVFRRFEGYEPDGITIKEFLLSAQFLNLLHQITNLSFNDIVSTFGSCYHHDCWLSTHFDGERGKIAYVYNLTKDWKEEYGGNFQLLHDNYCGIKTTVKPNFNAFTFFYIQGNQGTPHRVQRVQPDATGKRIAFSGWMK